MSEPSARPEGAVGAPPDLEQPSGGEREHASDQVFRELATAILNRELSPGTPLPPERELSERFGVSRIVVREAVHRLKEYELVRVRQGSPTLVLDADRATDIRLLGLEIELVPLGPEGMNAFAERQIYSAAGLLDLAEQRMTDEELDALERLIDERSRDTDAIQFDRAYWVSLARGTRNRIYVREVNWYHNLLERDARFRTQMPLERRVELYRALLSTQRNRSGSAALYLAAIRAHRGALV